MALSSDEIDRYARHLVLKEIGGPGQARLKDADVLIVGAGGLGAPAALYLAAAGVGRIALLDHDGVAVSNLQRQILYRSEDVGRAKVDAGADALTQLNPHVEVECLLQRLSDASALACVTGRTLVLDGTDDFATRFAVNQACVTAGVTLISGAVGSWTGQLATFKPHAPRSSDPAAALPCYRCLVPDAPPDAETCARVGVVGALTGVIGAMMAMEAIKEITRAGDSLAGRLLLYDALSATSRTVSLLADPACQTCGGLKR